MRSDLVDWVEFYEVEEGDDAPLIDLNDDAKDISEDSSNSTSEVDESRSSEPVVGKKKVEYIRLKPLQLCVVKIQNLLKVSWVDQNLYYTWYDLVTSLKLTLKCFSALGQQLAGHQLARGFLDIS